jgi:hypothetical protein
MTNLVEKFEGIADDYYYGSNDWEIVVKALTEVDELRTRAEQAERALAEIAALDEDNFKSAWHYQQAVRFHAASYGGGEQK